MEDKEKIEWYFFKYAFPCSQVLLQLKKITQEEYAEFKKMFADNINKFRKELMPLISIKK